MRGGAQGGRFPEHARSIYWAIVTLATVGYGDIAPVTPLGMDIAAVIMILGYAIIAIPTGIVSVDLSRQGRNTRYRVCTSFGGDSNADEARHYHRCGQRL